jgi:hypothetical protein
LTLVGTLGGTRLLDVDRRGTVRPERANWELAWWIGADDRWHFPEEEVAVRQSLLDGMPVVVTAMRVPGGDAVHRVYGAMPDANVVEVANESPAPFVVTLVVRGAHHIETNGPAVIVDGTQAIVGAHGASRWAVSTDGSTRAAVSRGGAHDGEFPALRDRGARLEAALLFPAAHGAMVRFALPHGRAFERGRALGPGADAVARGWKAQLERGMRVSLPDPPLQLAIETARAQVLLAGQAWIVPPEVVIALEDWGYDSEARTAWTHLGLFARRRASRRRVERASWEQVRASAVVGGAALLNAVRSALVADRAETIDLAVHLPEQWRGLPLDVRDAPTRAGLVSYSLRWHGERIALLWEVPANTTVRIPGIDPSWSTAEPRGETLLVPSR